MQFSSDITVELIKHSASDQDIVYAARVSTQGERSLDSTGGFSMEEMEKNYGLINYLMRDRHGSPFEHSNFTFYVKAPIFVWREHMRHRMASYNEESGRYRQLEPEFYVPAGNRKLVQTGKAGAYIFKHGTTEQYQEMHEALVESSTQSYQYYQQLLDAGIAREVARAVLPVNIYSSAYVTMNSRALMNFLSLRQNVEGQRFPSFPQREIEMVAERYEDIFKEVMPLTHQAFVENGRVAP
jgi:thymidylate synthase (FAD)